MLRPALHKEIQDLLNRPPAILADDFDIQATGSLYSVELTITYAAGDGQFYKATIPNEKSDKGQQRPAQDFKIKASFNPGELILGESQELWGSQALLKSIDAWVLRLAEDIMNTPVARALSEHQARLVRLEAELEQIPDEYVTVEQARSAKIYLDQVEAELRLRIEALENDAADKAKRIEELHQEFELLRQRVETTKLRRIVRAAASRFYHIASDPKFGSLIENGKKVVGLLGPGN